MATSKPFKNYFGPKHTNITRKGKKSRGSLRNVTFRKGDYSSRGFFGGRPGGKYKR